MIYGDVVVVKNNYSTGSKSTGTTTTPEIPGALASYYSWQPNNLASVTHWHNNYLDSQRKKKNVCVYLTQNVRKFLDANSGESWSHAARVQRCNLWDASEDAEKDKWSISITIIKIECTFRFFFFSKRRLISTEVGSSARRTRPASSDFDQSLMKSNKLKA
jgi:hypothetical protein